MILRSMHNVDRALSFSIYSSTSLSSGRPEVQISGRSNWTQIGNELPPLRRSFQSSSPNFKGVNFKILFSNLLLPKLRKELCCP